ncbi:MAG: 16S rRNA (guanine(527)-N(7))-methyltransferase RsmG, partial [Acidobacteriota bacterium]
MNREPSIRDILEKSYPQLTSDQLKKLVEYYEFVMKWNKRINLTTVTSVGEFAERHLGEAMFAAGCLSESIKEFWDIGSGLGIPGIPVAILRPDIQVHLVESNRKKSIFLEEAVDALSLSGVSVLNVRFETLGEFSAKACIAARAV